MQVKIKVLFLTRYGVLGASSRLRAFQYLPVFEKSGIDCTVEPLIADDLLSEKYNNGRYSKWRLFISYLRRGCILVFRRNKFDLIWIEKEAFPWCPVFVEILLLGKQPYVLDYDDAVFHSYDRHRSALVRYFFGARIDDLMKQSRLVVAGNQYLAARAALAGALRVEILPTVIDLERYPINPITCANIHTIRIVWIGSPSTIKYLEGIRPALVALRKLITFQLRIIGGVFFEPELDVECLPWFDHSEVLQIAECDIGIMPLDDSFWERGKCGYKLIQYMACGLPVVASPVGVNAEIVDHGINGYLVKTNEQWVEALEKLLTHPALRTRLGSAGRRRVEQRYCLQRIAPKLSELLLEAHDSE